MKRYSILMCLLLLTSNITTLQAQKKYVSYKYDIASTPWAESLGNHRAVIQIDKPTDVAALNFEWRRPDKEVDQRRMLIINAQTGDTISNVRRIEINNDRCRLQFGPVVNAGTYYFYYLPYQVQPGGGFYGLNYIKPEKAADSEWLNKAAKVRSPLEAVITNVESRTAFDTFFPMEVAATDNELATYKTKQKTSLYVFPEDRRFPIRMRSKLPLKWLDMKQGQSFEGEAAPNEYYALQIGVWAANGNINKISYTASDLKGGSQSIPASAITCLNTEGINPYGQAFKREVNVASGMVQPLWFGIDLPSDIAADEYNGTITISDENGDKAIISLHLVVKGTPLADRGDSETWRYSRLRWFNSTLGIDDTPIKPYTPMSLDGTTLSCLGRQVSIDTSTLLPAQIDSWNNNILESPIRFVIETTEGIKNLTAMPEIDEQTEGHISGSWKAEDNDIILSCKARMEFDGWAEYVYTIKPKTEVHVKDIRLVIPMKNEVASYFMGAGLPGQDTPKEYDGKWDAPEKTVNNFGVSIPTNKKQNWMWPFDSFWIGNTHAGLHCELRGSTYNGPLLNLYRPAYPTSWYNEGKGGFTVRRGEKATEVTAYSGERTLEAGKDMTFDFAFIITPVKELDVRAQFVNRYYHNGQNPIPNDSDLQKGIKIINVHHANSLNPFINYPFLSVDKMRNFTDEWHGKGCKVKMYYTLRELTTAMTELWALRSLDTEILRGGNGGGYPWCREHLVSDYTPQWYQHFAHGEAGIAADAALLTSESNSRLYNYYVEGLRWIVKNLHIDGLYLDDVSFDRRILKRMRRAMESVKPGCIIDLHSNTGFSIGPANQYTEFFPYVDKVWFGESFQYDKMSPANWITECSGIPFGLTGDMLQAGGNKWLGMQYGMTVRDPWKTEGIVCDPTIVWKVWDDFGIADAQMIGFWEKDVPVTASDNDVKVTVYKKQGKTLLSIGNYTDAVKKIHLNIDWKALGLNPKKTTITAPALRAFQDATTFKKDEEISVKPRQGWLIYLTELQ